MPVYEPDRERIIFDNIARMNQGPLSQIQLRQVYERLIDVMRQVQTEEMEPAANCASVTDRGGAVGLSAASSRAIAVHRLRRGNNGTPALRMTPMERVLRAKS